ncbi:alpha/beta-type small acid-soluble spore protein [Tepidibacter formicigenes]|jgi:hypothetical protein|uniref:Small, acid-soluble spore protein, alpha/beta type n=1 Tax=Tepidibacter formicigenes DSM 15518 TaxID=1123349 RepID=A0A1M6SX18_9FIRM|nr:alpha/beta-type small acid-soluble spore protein [Tepidibacter formicigenes]SHK49226.1 Small, acid-soluble spore protein, alpha/beta type [Tepidibacter formicigenes DSM 15518]
MSNKKLVPEAREALNQMKLEIANELGIQNSSNINKGDLSSRENGYSGGSVGGHMTRKLIEIAEKKLAKKQH